MVSDRHNLIFEPMLQDDVETIIDLFRDGLSEVLTKSDVGYGCCDASVTIGQSMIDIVSSPKQQSVVHTIRNVGGLSVQSD